MKTNNKTQGAPVYPEWMSGIALNSPDHAELLDLVDPPHVAEYLFEYDQEDGTTIYVDGYASLINHSEGPDEILAAWQESRTGDAINYFTAEL